jgi:predicted AlkP superfamily phosphohydrolase/phosphomutase
MNRFLLIGLDGGEASLIGPWMAAGRLPALAALRRSGSFLPLRSTLPPATFPAWTSCVTGVNPGRHGVFDFTEMREGAYSLRFTNSTYRKAPSLWTILSEAGRRVCVLGVPGTWPAEQVNGVLVSGFDSPVATALDPSFVYPPDRYPDVRDWRFADFQETGIGPGWHEKALPALLRKIGDKERIALRLLKEEAWDFFMMVFSETDTVSHHFWMYHDAASPRHRPGFEDAIFRVYQRIDEALGRLIEASDGMTAAVVSDHGFGGAGDGVVHLNNGLADRGWLRFSGRRGSFMKAAALNLTPPSWRGGLFRRFQGLAARAESRSRFGGIDWRHTRAWSEELNYFPAVRLNLDGREPLGQVPAADYDAVVRDLCAELETWDAIARALPRGEIYNGPYINRAPDIVLEPALENGYAHSWLRSRGGPVFRRLRPEEYPGGKERGMNGSHRDPGIVFFSRPCAVPDPVIWDIAPTVLAELGVAGPPMEGRPLQGGVCEITGAGNAPPAEKPVSAEEARRLEARLRKLGYYE